MASVFSFLVRLRQLQHRLSLLKDRDEPVLPPQGPCRLSDVLVALLSRRFGSSAIDVGGPRWVSAGPDGAGRPAPRGGPQSRVVALRGLRVWAAQPHGVGMRLSGLFDRPSGLAFQCEQPWLEPERTAVWAWIGK